MNMPLVLLVAMLLFWATAWVVEASPSALRANGWLLGSGGGAGPWYPLSPMVALPDVHWGVLWRHALQLGSVVFISLIAMLLIASSVELVARRDIDLNRELLAAGGANLLAGLCGTLPGYQSLSGCTLVCKLGTPIRLIGLIAALVCGSAFLLGDALLAVMPKLLVGIVLSPVRQAIIIAGIGRYDPFAPAAPVKPHRDGMISVLPSSRVWTLLIMPPSSLHPAVSDQARQALGPDPYLEPVPLDADPL